MRPNVVIVGGGFGGIQAAKALKGVPVDVTLIDKKNHHLFQPLLYQVATAGLSPADISASLRSVFKNQENVRIVWGEVTGVNHQKKQVLTASGAVSYDYLILATGSVYDYFGNDDWKSVALSLKTLKDATLIRQKILAAFENAEACTDLERRQQYMTFTLVGAGPTGVELAGAIAELSRQTLKGEYRNIDSSQAKIILIEASSEILGGFSPNLAKAAREDLEHLGVDVRLNTKVLALEPGKVRTSSEEFYSETILWTAGVRATPVAKWLGISATRSGKIEVDGFLAVPGLDNVYVVGDAAHLDDTFGNPLPAIAPVAIQQGKYVGRLIAKNITKKANRKPFKYKNKGMLATIGRARAIAQLPHFKFNGLPAWLLWAFVHILYLVGFENRVLVLIQWAWYYFSFKRGAQLISDERSANEEVK